VELGNFVLGVTSRDGTGRVASRALLKAMPGFSQSGSKTSQCNCAACQERRRLGQDHDLGSGTSGGYNSQDWGRKYQPANGGCAYIDLDHLELCIPEVASAWDYLAAWHAMLRMARLAMQRVNANQSDGLRVQILANNSDGLGNSYGSHLNVLVNRRTWENIFHRKLHYMLYLAAYQVSSIVFTGQGKVGSENKAPECDYQIAQRADFFETLSGVQTTYRRPIVNSRDESLCGRDNRSHASGESDGELARLHVIFYDSTLCHTATLLKAGVMQLVLAMLEAERLDPALILDDPLEAVVAWSHDPELTAKARTAGGEFYTATELQLKFLDAARRFAEQGGFEGVMPRHEEIIALWADTLDKLHRREFGPLVGRLDWLLKRVALERAMAQRPNLAWRSPELKHLDHIYSSIDPDDGLYWAYERAGLTEQLATAGEIERFLHEPPHDTRAYARAMLLRLAERERVDQVEWDSVRFKLRGRRGWPSYPNLELPDPRHGTKAETEHLFDGRPLEDVIETIEALQEGAEEEGRLVPESRASETKDEPLLLPAPQNAADSALN
ncbi:MAG: proteasome accessory factor PafA2 family protein, partial [Planctomycetaceae bacterium]